ncbi:mycofactocin-coupled SDR family oxidoreductase [Streptomyces blattellae]|uniref:mycofactocin-coupled SDR family oxidoreductase n=1 Tax=Streptomyces blattellae TaxID=2569855 RepID=UPI0012B9114D|nr:mycofactocin-coupled SDR family oxidoreductase [Streptomyces blattellae]
MPGRIDGKVALITGAARGQGRALAVRMAEEGADIIAVDNCADCTMAYPGGTKEDLKETASMVTGLGRRVVTGVVDVRDLPALEAAVAEGVAELGRLDVVAANAGISGPASFQEMTETQWEEMIATNRGGVWRTCKAGVPHIIEGGRGGSVILTSSGAALKGFANIGHYAAAKAGILGLMRTLAHELGAHRIRVNSILPTTVDTPMVQNDALYRLFVPTVDSPTRDDLAQVTTTMHALPVPWVDPIDIANAALFFAGDESRYITGAALPVDAGILVR